jgi:hypothetical protein
MTEPKQGIPLIVQMVTHYTSIFGGVVGSWMEVRGIDREEIAKVLSDASKLVGDALARDVRRSREVEGWKLN